MGEPCTDTIVGIRTFAVADRGGASPYFHMPTHHAALAAAESTDRDLALLLELSRTLASPLNLKPSLSQVLDVLQEQYEIVSGAITRLEDKTGELVIEASVGIPWRASVRARYRLGEGITGRVVETGRPVVVPRVSHEPLFLNRTGVYGTRGRDEMSYVCVPILVEQKAWGALGACVAYREGRDYEQFSRLLSVVAALIAQALRVEGLVEGEKQRLVTENTALRHELQQRYELRHIVGSSRAMQEIYAQVAQVAPTTTTVLLRGESGTGKEMVAHALHHGSARADKPFVKVSCAALPDSLIETELFGHEKGAFTDARAQKKGRFELAHGGTLFLDEVGELSPSTQVKLLRVLQEREFERVGGVEPIRVDVRVVTATNKDLEAALRQGTFREDLYYRLNVFTICLPPLRERRPDVLLLADHFVEKYAAAHGRDVRRLSTAAIDMLMSYHWPGNVRELENCMERAVLVSSGGVIHAHDLPATLQTAEVTGTLPRLSLSRAVGRYERDLIEDALKTTRGNRARAARMLHTTERIMGYKIRKHGIEVTRFRTGGEAPEETA